MTSKKPEKPLKRKNPLRPTISEMTKVHNIVTGSHFKTVAAQMLSEHEGWLKLPPNEQKKLIQKTAEALMNDPDAIQGVSGGILVLNDKNPFKKKRKNPFEEE